MYGVVVDDQYTNIMQMYRSIDEGRVDWGVKKRETITNTTMPQTTNGAQATRHTHCLARAYSLCTHWEWCIGVCSRFNIPLNKNR